MFLVSTIENFYSRRDYRVGKINDTTSISLGDRLY